MEAQTLANADLALEHDLEIIPVVNKMDLPAAQPETTAEEMEHVLGIPAEDCLFVSAKSGLGVAELLETIVKRVPAPKGDPAAPLAALIFDFELRRLSRRGRLRPRVRGHASAPASGSA